MALGKWGVFKVGQKKPVLAGVDERTAHNDASMRNEGLVDAEFLEDYHMDDDIESQQKCWDVIQAKGYYAQEIIEKTDG